MFFLFKQKTAYEMRISDWISDVCSSDLNDPVPPFDRLVLDAGVMDDTGSVRERGERTEGGEGGGDGRLPAFAVRNVEPDEFRLAAIGLDRRSEEHTSELQSLMRNSYAVFCLKQKQKLDNMMQHNNPYIL